MEESFNCFFGLEVTVGKSQKVIPEIGFLHISQAALATPGSKRVVVSVTIDGKSFTIGTLSPSNGVYHMPLDMNFMPDSEVEFSIEGDDNAKVHLTGYYELDDEDDELDDDAELGSEDLGAEEEEDDEQESAAEAKREPAMQKVETKGKVEEASSSDSDDSDAEDQEETSEEEGEETESDGAESDEEDDEDIESSEADSDAGSDAESDVESDEAPQKKMKTQHGGSFQKPHYENKQKFEHQHKRDGGNFKRGGFQSGNFNGGNRFGGNRGGLNARGSQNSRGGFGNRGFGNRGGHGGNRGGRPFNRGGNRGGFRGRH